MRQCRNKPLLLYLEARPALGSHFQAFEDETKKRLISSITLQKIPCDRDGSRQGNTQVVVRTRATIRPLSPSKVNTMLGTVEMSEPAPDRRKKYKENC